MSNSFVPPTMPPFPRAKSEVVSTLAPFYQSGNAIDLFFEFFIVDVLGELPKETLQAMNDFSSELVLQSEIKGDWRQWVRAKCNLSSTIETAILDLWFRNGDNARNAGWSLHPWYFAKLFSQNYFAEDSPVDVWIGDALEAAKARVAVRRKTN